MLHPPITSTPSGMDQAHGPTRGLGGVIPPWVWKVPEGKGNRIWVSVRRLFHNSFSELSPFPRLFSFFTYVLFFPLLSLPSFIPLRASHVLPFCLTPAAAHYPPIPNTHKAGADQGWRCDSVVCLTLSSCPDVGGFMTKSSCCPEHFFQRLVKGQASRPAPGRHQAAPETTPSPFRSQCFQRPHQPQHIAQGSWVCIWKGVRLIPCTGSRHLNCKE